MESTLRHIPIFSKINPRAGTHLPHPSHPSRNHAIRIPRLAPPMGRWRPTPLRRRPIMATKRLLASNLLGHRGLLPAPKTRILRRRPSPPTNRRRSLQGTPRLERSPRTTPENKQIQPLDIQQLTGRQGRGESRAEIHLREHRLGGARFYRS